MAKLINGLETLRGEFDQVNPNRERTSDGWIGDAHHAATVSDHNPDETGTVHAIDVDKDGVPMGRIVAFIVARCKAGVENRLQYVIYRRTIWSRSWGWTPRAYHGVNPHTKHAHFSERHGTSGSQPWGVADEFGPHTAGRTEHKPTRGKPVVHPAGSRVLELATPRLEGADVRAVQRFIERAQPVDGVYGPKTAAAVEWYQGMRGLKVDGVVGPATWRSMGVRWTGGS